MLTLDLALVTHRPEGIVKVADMNLPFVDGVNYIVSWQDHRDAPVPQALIRDDVKIYRFNQTGQSLNRNNAIDHCTSDLILNSDDDLVYSEEGLKAVIEAFEQNPDVDVSTFIAEMPWEPIYPPAACRLGEPLPKDYWVATFNIAFRRASVGNLRFHPEFGLGSRYLHGAEDELFLLSAIRRNLHCHFFPVVICVHPELSTGTKKGLTPANLRATGCYVAIAYPKSYLLRFLIKAWRLRRHKQSGFFWSIKHMIAGARKAPDILKGDRRYLW